MEKLLRSTAIRILSQDCNKLNRVLKVTEEEDMKPLVEECYVTSKKDKTIYAGSFEEVLFYCGLIKKDEEPKIVSPEAIAEIDEAEDYYMREIRHRDSLPANSITPLQIAETVVQNRYLDLRRILEKHGFTTNDVLWEGETA